MKAPIVLLIMVIFAGAVNAQRICPAASQGVQYHDPSEAQPVALSSTKMLDIERTAKQQSLSERAEAAIQGLVKDHIEGAADQLISGKSVELTAKLANDGDVVSQHSVNVSVSFDARPIGGILNVRVEVVPIFSGVGSAVRPAMSREFAQAIDNFDDDVIAQTILRLTKEMSGDLAAKS